MNKKMIIKYGVYIFLSLICGIAFIVISEITGLSRLNLIAMGGESWALWIHPLLMSIFFLFFGKVFQIKRYGLLFMVILVAFFILFYFVYNGKLFINPVPFN